MSAFKRTARLTVFIVLLLISTSAVVSAEIRDPLTFTLSDETVSLGKTIQVTITAENLQGVDAMNFDISYPREFLRFESITFNESFMDKNIWEFAEANNHDGMVTILIVPQYRSGWTGYDKNTATAIGTITFKALKEGKAELEFGPTFDISAFQANAVEASRLMHYDKGLLLITGSETYKVPGTGTAIAPGTGTEKVPSNPSTIAGVTVKTSLSDLEGHWAKLYIERLIDKKIVSGYVNGYFYPNKAITKLEFIKMLVASTNQPLVSNQKISFKDGRLIPNWAVPYVATAANAGWITGDAEGLLNGSKSLTRAEMAVILERARISMGVPSGSGNPTAFKDTPKIPAWAQNAVKGVAAAGLMSGTPEGYFYPNKATTRAEAAKVLVNAFIGGL